MILLYRNKVRSVKSFARRFNLQNRISLKNLQIQFFLQTPTFNNLQPGFDEAISNCCFDERKHSHKRWCRGQRMRFHFEIRFAEGIFATFSSPLPLRNFFSHHSLILLRTICPHRTHRAIKFEVVRALHEAPSRKQPIASKISNVADVFEVRILAYSHILFVGPSWSYFRIELTIFQEHCTFHQRKSIILFWYCY